MEQREGDAYFDADLVIDALLLLLDFLLDFF
jgi:hypothetical protein